MLISACQQSTAPILCARCWPLGFRLSQSRWHDQVFEVSWWWLLEDRDSKRQLPLQSNKCAISKLDGPLFDWKIHPRTRLVGDGRLSIPVRAYDRQTRCQIHWKHSWKWSRWQGAALAFGSIFGDELRHRPLHPMASGEHKVDEIGNLNWVVERNSYTSPFTESTFCHPWTPMATPLQRKAPAMAFKDGKSIRSITPATLDVQSLSDTTHVDSIWTATSPTTSKRTRNVSNPKRRQLRNGYQRFNSSLVGHCMVAPLWPAIPTITLPILVSIKFMQLTPPESPVNVSIRKKPVCAISCANLKFNIADNWLKSNINNSSPMDWRRVRLVQLSHYRQWFSEIRAEKVIYIWCDLRFMMDCQCDFRTTIMVAFKGCQVHVVIQQWWRWLCDMRLLWRENTAVLHFVFMKLVRYSTCRRKSKIFLL